MADPNVRTFDPAEVQLIVGTTVITGFGDGTFIKITRSGDAFDKKRGAAGDVDRINKNAFDFEVEVTLKRTAVHNATFSGLLAADQLSSSGIVILTIKDNSGNSLFEAPQAWIKKDPDTEYADSLGNYTWKFDTGPAANFIGGN